MKIRYEKVAHENAYIVQKCVYRFEIIASITKTHYKALAKMSMLFNSTARNVGFVKKENAAEFLSLIEKIEKSNDKVAAASHKKSIETARNRRNAISFDDYCEDHLDMHVALMSEDEKNEAYKSYRK